MIWLSANGKDTFTAPPALQHDAADRPWLKRPRASSSFHLEIVPWNRVTIVSKSDAISINQYIYIYKQYHIYDSKYCLSHALDWCTFSSIYRMPLEDAASDETILVGTAGGQSEPRNPAASIRVDQSRQIQIEIHYTEYIFYMSSKCSSIPRLYMHLSSYVYCCNKNIWLLGEQRLSWYDSVSKPVTRHTWVARNLKSLLHDLSCIYLPELPSRVQTVSSAKCIVFTRWRLHRRQTPSSRRSTSFLISTNQSSRSAQDQKQTAFQSRLHNHLKGFCIRHSFQRLETNRLTRTAKIIKWVTLCYLLLGPCPDSSVLSLTKLLSRVKTRMTLSKPSEINRRGPQRPMVETYIRHPAVWAAPRTIRNWTGLLWGIWAGVVYL